MISMHTIGTLYTQMIHHLSSNNIILLAPHIMAENRYQQSWVYTKTKYDHNSNEEYCGKVASSLSSYELLVCHIVVANVEQRSEGSVGCFK